MINRMNNNPTIVYAIPFFDETGPMRAPYQLCKGFLDTGWSVIIETLKQEGNSSIDIIWGKVPIKKFNGINKKYKMLSFIFNFLKKREGQVVISWVWYWHCFSLLLSKIFFKNPYVIVMDSYTHLSSHDLKGPFSKLRLELRYGLILRFADVIIAETASSYEHVQRYIKAPQKFYIPICFWKKDLDVIEQRWSEERFQPQREPVVFYAGRITEIKKIHHLIEAFNRLSVVFPNWKLEIRGPVTDPSYLESLKNLVSRYGLGQRIQFLPALYGEDLYRRYRSTSIYCLPSSFEGIPTTILEAMYFGGAVVAASSGHIKFQLEEGNCGLLFKPGDIDKLAEHLRLLMESSMERDNFIEKSRRRVLEHFIWERYFNQLDSSLRKLIQS
jgi:glycosyltransferase involved in cell wall biosynthesis